MLRVDRRPVGTFAAMLAGLLGLVLFGLWLEETARRAQVAQVREALHQSSLSLGQHAADMIEVAELTLAMARATLARQPDMSAMQALLDDQMGDMAGHARHIERIVFLDRLGNGTASLAPASEQTRLGADLAYFRHHREDGSTDPYLGAPTASLVTGEPVIPVSIRLEDAQQNFAGVLAVEMPPEVFSQLFSRLASKPGGMGAVLRNDGTPIALASSTPLPADYRMPWSEVIAPLALSAPGTVTDTVWPNDERRRHMAAAHFDHPAITVIAAVDDEELLWTWLADARSRLIIGGLLIGMGLILTLRWWHRVTLHHESLRLLKQTKEEFRLLADASADMIEKLSLQGVREYVSPASQHILGLAPDELVGTSILDHLQPEERAQARHVLENLRRRAATERVVVRYLRPDGRESWLETSISRLHDSHGDGTGMVAITRDVTAHKQHADQLDALAHMDGLTGLPNRRSFDLRLEMLASAAAATGKTFALLMIDIDRFKLYNDSYGHAAGDACLKRIASTISQSLRKTDFAARYGGEEFAVMIEGIDQTSARLVAEKIRKRVAGLRIPHDRNHPWGYATISIGVAEWETEMAKDTGSPGIIEAADQALYAAKEQRNRVMILSGNGKTTDHGAARRA
ncbi:diguanylate cyclase with PAS/PAC sensor [Rhizobium sp. RU35A]|uniref:diguanylate cyclase domain-containing protein n=1 Tax=Rhizobium sp. RU35A TaxID=1907414 RepID=UPI00095460EC|nr:diguanylate cyclase [Rhizobium sp. RU35A]SIQ56535.1 diguanylate cyclase with PAS/PAC sensor [Rhizobium sp. RU35A]